MAEHEEVCKGYWEMERTEKKCAKDEKLADEGEDVARGCACLRMFARLGKGDT